MRILEMLGIKKDSRDLKIEKLELGYKTLRAEIRQLKKESASHRDDQPEFTFNLADGQILKLARSQNGQIKEQYHEVFDNYEDAKKWAMSIDAELVKAEGENLTRHYYVGVVEREGARVVNNTSKTWYPPYYRANRGKNRGLQLSDDNWNPIIRDEVILNANK